MCWMMPFIKNSGKCKLIFNDKTQITGCLGMVGGRWGGGEERVAEKLPRGRGISVTRLWRWL